MPTANEMWLQKVRAFPVSLLLVTNVAIALLIAIHIFLFYRGYIAISVNGLEQMSPSQIHFYFSEGIERFVFSISAWISAIFGISFGSGVFIARTKKAILDP